MSHKDVGAAKPGRAVPVQAWGEPFAKLDAAWTLLESRLCALVLGANVLALCVWVFFSGMSAEGNAAGVVFRAFAGATVLGFVAHKATKSRPETQHVAITTGAVLVGLATPKLWSHVGVEYMSNVLNWIQNASVFMLFGGLRTPGLATRLTLLLALLGASIATAQGKHINVDVMMRFLAPRARVPVAIIGWLVAGAMCLTAAWGFLDHIAIQDFHAPRFKPCAGTEQPEKTSASCDTPASEKLAVVGHGVGADAFLLGRQLSLDLKSFPKVLAGTPYNQYMTASEWNAWLAGADWTSHFKAEDVQALVLPTDTPGLMKMPAVSVPGGAEDPRGLLTKDLDFVFVFALVMIALRFGLRSLLALSGHVAVDPDAAHGEPDVASHHPSPTPPKDEAEEAAQ